MTPSLCLTTLPPHASNAQNSSNCSQLPMNLKTLEITSTQYHAQRGIATENKKKYIYISRSSEQILRGKIRLHFIKVTNLKNTTTCFDTYIIYSTHNVFRTSGPNTSRRTTSTLAEPPAAVGDPQNLFRERHNTDSALSSSPQLP